MAEKLSEAIWTGFTKKQKLTLDDAALVKALAKFDKTVEAKPEPRLEALGEVVEQVKKQVAALAKRKKELGDKVFGEVKDKLYALLDTAEVLQKETQQAVSAAAAKKDDGDDEEESPALLTTKMLPLLRELRKGDLVLQALVALAGKETVVLLSRRAISPARGKLLKEQMTNPSGLKFIRGECLFEQGSVTFVVQAAAAGLAKKIKAALLQQTDLRLKVRVRGEDPDDVDEVDEDEREEAAAASPAEDPRKARFDARVRELDPALATALKDVKRSDLTKLRAVSAFAREKADAADWGAAMKALDMLSALLDASPAVQAAAAAAGAAASVPEPGTAEAGTAGVAPAEAFNARLAALVPRVKEAIAAGAGADAKARIAEAGARAKQRDYDGANALLDAVEASLAPAGRPAATVVQLQQSRLAWDTQRKAVQTQLQALEREVRAAVAAHNADETAEDEYDDADLAQGISHLHQVLQRLDSRLIDKLDQALNAEGAKRRALQAEAAALVRQYQAYVDTDPLMADIDDNGFTTVSIRADTLRTLARLAQQL